MMAVHVYQSYLTGHWIVDRNGTKSYPGSCREGYRKLPDALVAAWGWVQEHPKTYNDVVVQR